MVAYAQRARIVELHRIRYREDRTRACSHPDRLIIDRPIEKMREAAFLQKVWRDGRLDGSGAHPSGWPYADVLGDDLDTLLDVPPLVVLPQPGQCFGVAAAVPEDVVSSLFDLFDDLGVLVADRRIQEDRGRELEFVQHLEKAPIADAIAVVEPGIIAGRRGAAESGLRIESTPCPEREMLDVQRKEKGEALAVRPGIMLPFVDRKIVVTLVMRQFQHCWMSFMFGRCLMQMDACFDCARHSRAVQPIARR